jgi:cation-transporting ATPase 13A2
METVIPVVATADYQSVPTKDGTGKELPSDDFDVSFQWVKVSTPLLVLFYFLVLCTGGLLAILCVNLPLLQLNMTTVTCPPAEATLAFVNSKDGTFKEYCEVENHTVDNQTTLCLEVLSIRYYATSKTNYEIARVPAEPDNFSEAFVDGSASAPSREYRQVLFGLNRLRLPVADAFTVVVLEMLSPFYLFQYFAVAVWFATDYIAYSVIVLFITGISIYFVCSDKLYNIKRLHELADVDGDVEFTAKDGKDGVTKSNQQLVPGDYFCITPDMVFPCDAILLQGKVVVDESMLTGESVPVTKTEFVKDQNNSDATKRKANVLYCGTRVRAIGTNDRPIAVAYRTGFRSSKGMIIGTLARPQREIISFLPDALWSILFMVVITTCIFAWTAKELKKLDTADADVFVAYLTALTIAVPPGLVACLSIATSISVVRLNKKKISISDTTKLTAAGYVTYACFDKTGTLTDENILFRGLELFKDQQGANEDDNIKLVAKLVMAACHSLSILDNGPVGDQLEMELLRESAWALNVEPESKLLQVKAPGSLEAWTMARNFEYSPERLRAGVVVVKDTADQQAKYLLKGSPEVIVAMCNPATVPANIQENMVALAERGYRVLALAYRELTSQPKEWINTAAQTDLEANELTFLGLVYFQNKLKSDTYPKTVASLQEAKIRVNMITGDHIYTAVAISTECNILPPEENRTLYIVDADDAGDVVITSNKSAVSLPLVDLIKLAEATPGPNVSIVRLAITGGALRLLASTLAEDVFNRLVRSCSVFARVKPDQKKLVVTELKKPVPGTGKPTYVMFCGDGANDMEALAVATVGVSLCDTSTTVAASIVSLTESPFSTVEVLREGRCSLVTAYMLVLFNIMYAIIQYFMTCFLNNLGLVFGDNMYIVQDMFFSLFLGLCIANTLPDDALAPNVPPPRLFTPGLMFRLFSQLAIFPAFQAILLHLLTQQDWYTKFVVDDYVGALEVSWAPECSQLQILCLAQLMIASVVVTIGRPFRQPWYYNKVHLFVLLCQAGYIFYLLFCDDDHANRSLENYPVSHHFSGILIGLIAANVATSAVFAKLGDWLFPY